MKMTRHQVDGSKGNTGIMEQKGIVMVLGDFNGEVFEEMRAFSFAIAMEKRLRPFFDLQLEGRESSGGPSILRRTLVGGTLRVILITGALGIGGSELMRIVQMMKMTLPLIVTVLNLS